MSERMPNPKFPNETDRQWMDRIVRCATSCAATIEARKLLPHEVPLVLGSLVIGLSDLTGLPMPVVMGMVNTAAKQLRKEAPEHMPGKMMHGADEAQAVNREGQAS